MMVEQQLAEKFAESVDAAMKAAGFDSIHGDQKSNLEIWADAVLLFYHVPSRTAAQLTSGTALSVATIAAAGREIRHTFVNGDLDKLVSTRCETAIKRYETAI